MIGNETFYTTVFQTKILILSMQWIFSISVVLGRRRWLIIVIRKFLLWIVSIIFAISMLAADVL